MKLWLDAHLPPAIAPWIQESLGIETLALRDLGLRDAKDARIFEAARNEGAVVVTKDQDFVTLLETHGPPPQVIWITCGNTSNAHLRRILAETSRRLATCSREVRHWWKSAVDRSRVRSPADGSRPGVAPAPRSWGTSLRLGA